MNWVHQTLAEFGQTIGINGLDLGAHGVAQLEFQSGARLAVEANQRGKEEEILIYVSQPCGFELARILPRALASAHFSQPARWPVQLATQGEGPEASLILLLRMRDRDFTLQSLGEAVDQLMRRFDELR